jgi:hypothetical protein
VQREEAAEFFNRTSAGGAITIVSALFMALLFFSELRECPARREVQSSCQGGLLAFGAGCPRLARCRLRRLPPAVRRLHRCPSNPVASLLLLLPLLLLLLLSACRAVH